MELKTMLLLVLVFIPVCLSAGGQIGDHPTMNITAVEHQNVSMPSTTIPKVDTWKFSATERYLPLFEYKQNEVVLDICGQRCSVLIEGINNTYDRLTPILHNVQVDNSGPYRIEWFPDPLIPFSIQHLDMYLNVTKGELTTPRGITSAAPALYTAYLPAVFLAAIGHLAIITLMA